MPADPDADALPLRTRTRFNLGLLQTLATFALTVFILYAARPVILPVAMAVLFVFILSPVVRYLERVGLPRMPAVLATVLLVGGVLGGLGYVIGSQMTTLARELPNYKPKIQAKIDNLRGSGGLISELSKMVDDIAKGGAAKGNPPAEGTPEATPDAPAAPAVAAPKPDVLRPNPFDGERTVFISSPKGEERTGALALLESVLPVAEPLANVALVFILTIFLLVNREDMRNRIIGLFGRGKVTGTTRVLTDAAERVSRFLLFQFLVNTTFGIVLGIGLYLIGVQYPLLWGFLSAMLRFIPYVGTWISALFPFLISFATSDGWAQPLEVFGFFLVLDLFTGNVVEPLLFGHQTGVSPVALLLAAAFWAWIWGPVGLLLSTPITVCLAVIGAHVPKLKPLAMLLGDKPALDPYVAFYQRLLAKDKAEAATLVTPPAGPTTAANATLGTFDAVVLPALGLARRDRQGDLITGEEETELYDMTAAIVAGAPPEKPATGAAAAPTAEQAAATERAAAELAALPVVIGAPAQHRVDELPLQMLAAGLPAQGRRLVTLTSRQLPLEVEQAVGEHNAVAVVISIVPPGGVPQAVYLIKRLRTKYPDLLIVVAYLGRTHSFDRLLMRFRRAGATQVTTSLVQTADMVKAPAAPGAGTPVNAPAGGPGQVPAAAKPLAKV